MSVYVDTPFKWELKHHAKFDYKWWSHMLADSVEELHRMARKIGLKKEWYQENNMPHYDVTIPMRRKAVAAGAKEITRKEVYELIQRHRASKVHEDSGHGTST